MVKKIFSVITATGSYIPPHIVKNEDFIQNEFFSSSGSRIDKKSEEIIEKFKQITEIEERRYVDDHYNTSDIGYFAARKVLENSGTNKEELDYIIVAHNFGDVAKSKHHTDMVPSIASRIKYKLGIENPYTIAYDLPFGCPGWLQALIQADYFIKSGDAKKIMVVGSETLSRVSDPHDIDTMLYADGAGAVLLESVLSEEETGIIAHITRSDTLRHNQLLTMNVSYNPSYIPDDIFLKMNGRKLYEYALNTVPQVVRDCIAKAGIFISDIKKVLIHQANAKMNQAIFSRLFNLFGIDNAPLDLMPMTISKLGNNSVATLPILFDLLVHGNLPGQNICKGDYIVFASVGAGMNINALIYRNPF